MAGLWDDATAPFTGQQPPQDNSSLWGWLTSLFRSGQPPQAPQMAPSTPQVYTGPGVTPSLYPGSSPTGAWPSAAPASLPYAPPSLYTATNPQQQALWNQASTPAGWAALAAQGANAPAVVGGGGGAARPRAPQVPIPANPMPAGGTTGFAGVQGLPGTQSGIDPRSLIANPNNPMPAGGSQGWAGYPRPDTLTMAAPPPTAPASPPPSAATASIPPPGRTLSDAEVARMTPGDIRNVLTRSNLTAADNAALEARLNAMLRGM